jgi:hypothetical protein
MRIAFIANFIALVSISALIGCGQDSKLKNAPKKNTAALAYTDSVSGIKYTKVEELDADAREAAPKTRISFEQINVELPEAKEGTKVKHTFKFKNTGNAPLLIYSATGSCGCTVPEFSKEPVAPGASGEIKVVFDSEGRVGSNSKTVTVNANTLPPTTQLKFSVKVNAK